MSFQPNPGDPLVINGTAYVVGQHPAAPGLAYAQAGRQGIVYQLVPVDGEPKAAKALKVFFPKFRLPAMVYQTETMEGYSESPGLQVCKRDVLTPERNGELIAEHPDLLYSVLMPWIYGLTWFDVITDQRQLEHSESISLAKALAGIGSGMEQRGLAHCDLSAPNVMLPFFSEVDVPDRKAAVELVDVEQMYSPKLDRPDALLAGSPGYAAHRTVQSGLWSGYADRFAGAVIIAEMLGWCDPLVVGKAWGESYFDQHEMQNPCERYHILKQSLERNWGGKVADLFSRAWDSQDLSSCPTFGEWLVVLSKVQGSQAPIEEPLTAAADEIGTEEQGLTVPSGLAAASMKSGRQENPEIGELSGDMVRRLFLQAREMESAGNLKGALEVYRSAHHFSNAGSPMQIELEAAITDLELQLAQKGASDKQVKPPFYRSRKWILSGAAALVLIAGSGLAVNQILAERNESKHKKEAAQEATAKVNDSASKAQDQGRGQKDNDDAEKPNQQEINAKQTKYEAELKQKQQEEAKQAERKRLQVMYDKQAKYEAYLAQKAKEDKAKEQAEKTKKEQEKKRANTEAQKLAEAKAVELKQKRSQQTVLLNASYNQAFNAQKTGNSIKARAYALEFINRYEKDADYYKTVSSLNRRAAGIYRFLSNGNYELPNI